MESVYEGLKYKLRLEFPAGPHNFQMAIAAPNQTTITFSMQTHWIILSDAGYPYQSPTVKFTTPCFHPNVDSHGNICLDILKEKWSALYEVDFADCEPNSVQLWNFTLNCLSGSNDPPFHPVSVGWEEIILEFS